MKILYFLTTLKIGGAEKFCIDLCNQQSEDPQNEIFLCILSSIDEEKPFINNIASNIKLISLDKRGGYSIKMIYIIYRLLSKIQPDVIHLNGTSLIYASIPIIIKKIPSVYTVHTMADKEYGKNIIKYNKFLFTFFHKLFIPVAISPSVLKTIQKIYGTKLNKIIYNGSVELSVTKSVESVHDFVKSLKKDEETLVFVYIGRIAKEKNILLLIQAFNQLLNDSKNVCLCIIGNDVTINQSYLLECKNENRYPERVQFVGRRDNIADYLLYANATCLTSNYEGLGIAALEAFSMGVPVISTPSGGPSDIIISGLNGYVSKQISVEYYVEILKKFIQKPLSNKEQIIKLYKEKYTMKACALQYMDLYKEKVKR